MNENMKQEQNAQAVEPACENADIVIENVNEAEEDVIEEVIVEDDEIVLIEVPDEAEKEMIEDDEIVLIEVLDEDAEEPAPETKKGQPAMGMAIASMILAIASQIFGGGLILSIIALVLAVTAQKKGNTTGFATAGKVIALISTILWSVLLVTFVLIIVLAMIFAV